MTTIKIKEVSQSAFEKVRKALIKNSVRFEDDVHWIYAPWLSELPQPFMRIFKNNEVVALLYQSL